MRKAARLLFCVFALAASFQLIGIEEAFCGDSAMEAGCQECATCIGHQHTGMTNLVSLPAIAFNGYILFHDSFQPIEHHPLNLLRPPIAR